MSRSLSIVIPVHDEAEHLSATVDALAEAAGRGNFTMELIVVDDGSTDGSASIAEAAVADRLPLKILAREQAGRFKARRAGVEAATSDWVLLLDARVRLHRDSLRFLGECLTPDSPIWNGHVVPQTHGNPFGAFGNVLVHIAWARYFDNPRPTSYGLDDFDHFPKGTGCFVAPRELLLQAMDAFVPRVSDWRLVSDDTQLIRWIAARHRIHLSPEFGCDYQPRTSLRSFVDNALYRGSTFLDGHGRTESRFYALAVGFYPVSAALTFFVLRRPLFLPILIAVAVGGGGAVASRARRPVFEIASFAALTPVYAVAHGAGMWRALAVLARQRLAGARKT
ncbi:MAG: glycosyltransferase [Actinobacteria bacterium]|nr:MAG: glycosyltransferase [Actinomycetota bacterium]